ncbi:DMT family transporter [Saccharothrix sp. HUAS TT1]|uniref:DMT family transporter n=1 Tax=unclassified Saccharothrix TaxID=2593673 RepID=UPI00345C0A2F
MWIAVLCALTGAVLSAVGAALQHSGVRDVGDLTVRRFTRLVGNRRWLLGFSVLVVAATLQVLALAMAPVTVVAPLAVLSLPIIAAIGVTRVTPVFAVAVGAATAGVATFVALAARSAVTTDVPPAVALRAGQVVAGVVGVFVVVAAFRSGTSRALALAAGAGAAYGLVAVLVRDVATSLPEVPWASFVELALAFLVGASLVQLGYGSGPADLVVAGQTVVNPIVAAWIGMALLDETPDAGRGTVVALVASAAVSLTGIAAIARFHHRRLAGNNPGG